ncbi:hypothetical protein [Clostridium sp.]|uniref:hypothetical protein n=1 Tax=Clostridium sp. TaxID=1506 RepID=UPI003D6D437B
MIMNGFENIPIKLREQHGQKNMTDEKLVLNLILYYVEMGIEFTNTYGDINESFYNSVEGMYQLVVDSINKHKDSGIFNILRKSQVICKKCGTEFIRD